MDVSVRQIFLIVNLTLKFPYDSFGIISGPRQKIQSQKEHSKLRKMNFFMVKITEYRHAAYFKVRYTDPQT